MDGDETIALDGAEWMDKHTRRRKRRRARLRLIHGPKAVRKHMRKTGRTGAIRSKKNHSTKDRHFKTVHPNAPFSGWGAR